MMRWLAGLSLILGIGLAGCSSVDSSGPPELGQTQFTLQGRLGVRWQGDSQQAQLNWQHGSTGDWMTLEGPLGQTVASLSRTASQVELQTTEGRYVAPDPESLTEKVLGWRLPLQGLSYWVQGKLDPMQGGEPERDEQGRLQQLQQQDWLIRVSSYFPDHPTAGALPRKLSLQRDGLELRLVVDQWTLPDGTTLTP
ncbi:lipoprotein insertase outer membrane protein LolB [Leeia sp.]|uniref:lipoprotein insertase outer membrane protein LolB n=1 Tax=Leeia sp. TaxID=2884678 RepID=UPI0035B04D7B